MSLVDRYVGGTIVRHFASALAGLLAVFAVINLTEELRSAGSPGWGVGRAIWFVVLTLPSEAYTLFPAAALLGAVLGLGRMAGDNEILALHRVAMFHQPEHLVAALGLRDQNRFLLDTGLTRSSSLMFRNVLEHLAELRQRRDLDVVRVVDGDLTQVSGWRLA